jgi:hypothetical protein
MRSGVRPALPQTFLDIAREYARVLGTGLLVLDDVPNTNADNVLAQQLYELVAAIVAVGGHVLITGHSPLPATARHPSIVSLGELPVPDLTVDEVREVLASAGLDGGFLGSGTVELIHATTSGHPILVAATVRYIQSHPAALRHARLKYDVLTSSRSLHGSTGKPATMDGRWPPWQV